MRPSSIKRSLGVDLAHQIQESRVLLVGAGGIGCELLKNLVLTGFGEIHIIDLDTIDLSNLNRQFLFRREHIKKPKALVAKEVAHKFQPNAKLEAYHANIMDRQFNIDWFQGYNIVFNALDNLAARQHVNHMCLAAGVPLIESGTTGFNGQVQVIQKGDTECYDCNEKEIPKSHPICTIRSNPTLPIHCIVWAKSWLLPELFGESEEESDTIDSTEDAENADEIATLKKEALALKEIRDSMGTDAFFRKVFEKVFKTDLERLRGMEGMWKERQPPDVFEFDKLESDSAEIELTVSQQAQKPWTLEENFVVFKNSMGRLSERLIELQTKALPGDKKPILSFDKDDEDTLDFVTAAANLRSAAFHIELKSKFDTKQLAGNIIPAIATTNAMTAGLCVLQAFKVLQKELSQARMVFLERSGARAINSDSLDPPKASCTVCSTVHGRVSFDPERATLGDLVEVLRSELDYKEELSIVSHGQNKEGRVIYDPDFEENLPNKLEDYTNNSNYLTISDEDDMDQDPRVNIELFFVERPKDFFEDSKPVKLLQTLEIPRRPKNSANPPPEDTTMTNGTSGPGKRKRDDEDEEMTNGHVAKKGAIEQANHEDVIDLDQEADSGAILID